MNKKIIIIGLLCLLSLTSCKTKKDIYEYASKYYFYLDTTNVIKVEYDATKSSKEEVDGYLNEVNGLLLHIEEEFSAAQTLNMKTNDIVASTLMKVNENSGKEETVVSDEFISLLKLAINIALDTLGGFDPTIGSLTSLWDISSLTEYCKPESLSYDPTHCKIPSKDEVTKAIETIGYEKIVINEDNNTVYLPNGTHLDFGGIAKGYAADEVMKLLKTKGFTYISVSLGGNLLVDGESESYKIEGKKVLNYIENPFNPSTTIISTSETGISIVSSGVHERYIEVDNVIYHHLLSTKTGYPIDNGLVFVSIIGPSSATCDGLSTGVFAMGLEKGLAYIKTSNYDGIIITKNKEMYIIGNFQFQFMNEIDKEFSVKIYKK